MSLMNKWECSEKSWKKWWLVIEWDCFLNWQIHTSQGEVQALAEVSGGGEGSVAVDLNSVTEATLGQDGQIILTGEDGHGKTVFYRLCTVAGQELLEQWIKQIFKEKKCRKKNNRKEKSWLRIRPPLLSFFLHAACSDR